MSFDTASSIVEIPGTSVTRPGDVRAVTHDPDSDWLLFAGNEGRVRVLDLREGCSQVLLEPLEPGSILALDLTRDRSTLAVTSRPHDTNLGNRRGFAIQFWNYAVLCRQAKERAS